MLRRPVPSERAAGVHGRPPARATIAPEPVGAHPICGALAAGRPARRDSRRYFVAGTPPYSEMMVRASELRLNFTKSAAGTVTVRSM